MSNTNLTSDGAVGLDRAGTTIERFGSFLLAGTEFALPVAALQEVVNYPESVTPVPLTPRHVIGLFNLRGTLIPVVDPRPLLQLPDDDTRSMSKIAVVELGEARVGIVFDSTGEILRVAADQCLAIERPDGEASVICSVLKLDGGERIVQVLSPAALLGLPDLPQPGRRATHAGRRIQQVQRQQTVSIRVAGVHLALPMTAILEIIRVPTMLHPSPLADAACVGMLNLRGMTVPVIDFARLLNLPTGEAAIHPGGGEADERRIVVLRRGEVHFGLLVDEVCSIVGYRDDELLEMPAYSRRYAALFTGCISREGRDNVIVLSPEALFAHEQVLAITSSHRELTRGTSESGAGVRERSRGVRETYVAFRLSHLLGVHIGQLREVIDHGAEVTPTPGSPAFVLGVLTLRRELVTVIDLRAMLGMPACEDLSQAKVLIVEHREEKYGLVVDAIDNIVTIDSTARIPMPSILRKQAGQGLSQCMRDVVQLPDGAWLMLVDLTSLYERMTEAVETTLLTGSDQSDAVAHAIPARDIVDEFAGGNQIEGMNVPGVCA